MFTVTTTRKCPPISTNILKEDKYLIRSDIDEQTTNFKIYLLQQNNKWNEKHKKEKFKLMSDPKNLFYMLKALLFEAKKKDLSTINDSSILNISSVEWDNIISQIEDRFFHIVFGKNKLKKYDIIAIETLFNEISSLGIWYDDIASPRYRRYSNIISMLYTRFSVGMDVDEEMKILDKYVLIEKGELPGEKLSIKENKIFNKMIKLTRIIMGNVKYEYSQFVLQSRELRQMIKLNHLGKNKFLNSTNNTNNNSKIHNYHHEFFDFDDLFDLDILTNLQK